MSETRTLFQEPTMDTGTIRKIVPKINTQQIATNSFDVDIKTPTNDPIFSNRIQDSQLNISNGNDSDALDVQQANIVKRFVEYSENTKHETPETVLRNLGISTLNAENFDISIVIGSRFSSEINESVSRKIDTPAVLVITRPDSTTIIAETIRHSTDAVTTKILDSKSGNILFEVNYRVLSNGNFAINAPVSIVELDSTASLNDLNLAAWSVFEIFSRRSKSTKEQEGKDDRKLQGAKPETMCINHDLLCTSPFGGTLKFPVYVPCIGFFLLDAEDCCYDHDLGWWCARSVAEKVLIDLLVSTCLARRIISFVSYNTPWWCGGGITGSIVGLAQAMLYGYVAAIVLPFFFPREGRVGGGYVEGDPDSTSCMCGGNVPTYVCNLDPSKPASWQCPKDYCTNCVWVWEVDTNGNKANCRLDKTKSWLPCCPGQPRLPLDLKTCITGVEAVRRR